MSYNAVISSFSFSSSVREEPVQSLTYAVNLEVAIIIAKMGSPIIQTSYKAQ
jgi:hypothetical protein|tara:strand:- start:159 stop:314 length:156 start_codon:yes stop_codon:yes gene_type:complete